MIVLIPSLMKWMYSMKHLSVKNAMLSLHWSSFFIAISRSQTLSKMSNTKIDHTTSNKPAYSVAILILLISLYFVKYEILSKVEEKTNSCPVSGASWIPRLELLALNQSRIVKRCSHNYSDVVKVETRHWDIKLTELTPQVYNGECRNTPEVVVIAGSSEDVAEVVKFVRDQELELSVRSGGHSYACTSSRVASTAH